MPELPEVETIRRDLEPVLMNQTIATVLILDKERTSPDLATQLPGQTIHAVRRRGKLLIMDLSSGGHLIIHLKMTGQLIYIANQSTPVAGGHSNGNQDDWSERFTRVIITFQDGSLLRFNDLRRFGYLKLVNQKTLSDYLEKTFGIEPLTPNFTLENFLPLFRGRRTNLKAFLLNQKLIAGLGNIYVDEVCFTAGVLPTKIVTTITLAQQQRLFSAINTVITQAVKNRGTTFKDFVDGTGEAGYNYNYLAVFGHTNQPCQTCATPIKKIRLAGRGTHYCPSCQK
ncbi:MAG: bifunctional DNA-formamidopyrimidine glycosylase/DNA-(apurinic or apyrimidinic site) lyase [Patescibacteria group bacterium]